MMTPRGSILVTMASDQINTMADLWGEDLTCSLYWSVDASRILRNTTAYDFVACHHRKGGIFDVKLVYHA
jgi:hypothetical protein